MPPWASSPSTRAWVLPAQEEWYSRRPHTRKSRVSRSVSFSLILFLFPPPASRGLPMVPPSRKNVKVPKQFKNTSRPHVQNPPHFFRSSH